MVILASIVELYPESLIGQIRPTLKRIVRASKDHDAGGPILLSRAALHAESRPNTGRIQEWLPG